METSVHEWIGTCSSDKCGVSDDRWKHPPSISPDPELDQFNFKMRDCRDRVFCRSRDLEKTTKLSRQLIIIILFCFVFWSTIPLQKDSIILSHFFNCSVSLSVTDRQLNRWYQYVLVGQRRRFQRWKQDFRLLLPDTFCYWDQFLFYVFQFVEKQIFLLQLWPTFDFRGSKVIFCLIIGTFNELIL